jgi:NADH-quinone oxidoreductase subunit E
MSSQPDGGIDPDVIAGIVANVDGVGCGMVGILQEIQGCYGYLPEAALRMVAERTKRSLVDIYGVATFYRSFSLQPRGRHMISVCLGTACHVRGAPMVVEEFERRLDIRAGETTPDGNYTLETVNCLGACALGPIVCVDGEYFSKVDAGKVRKILSNGRRGGGQTDEAAMETPRSKEADVGASVV